MKTKCISINPHVRVFLDGREIKRKFITPSVSVVFNDNGELDDVFVRVSISTVLPKVNKNAR